MVSSMVLSSYPSSRLKCSLSNPQSVIMMSSPQPTVALLFPVRLGGAASFAEFGGLRIQMGSKLSPSLVSINTRRNPKVFLSYCVWSSRDCCWYSYSDWWNMAVTCHRGWWPRDDRVLGSMVWTLPNNPSSDSWTIDRIWWEAQVLHVEYRWKSFYCNQVWNSKHSNNHHLQKRGEERCNHWCRAQNHTNFQY